MPRCKSGLDPNPAVPFPPHSPHLHLQCTLCRHVDVLTDDASGTLGDSTRCSAVMLSARFPDKIEVQWLFRKEWGPTGADSMPTPPPSQAVSFSSTPLPYGPHPHFSHTQQNSSLSYLIPDSTLTLSSLIV